MKSFISVIIFLLSSLSFPAMALERIVSLSPSITETLFAVGAGKQVIAVTRFCSYPPEVKTKETVGGFLDLEMEKLIALKPDMVFLLNSDRDNASRLRKLGIPVTMITQERLSDIENAIRKIGQMTGHEDQAQSLLKEIARKRAVKGRSSHGSKRILLVAGRDQGSLKNIYVAGNTGFYNEIISLAGYRNAFTSPIPLQYPSVSVEGILDMDPDVIVELVDNLRLSSVNVEALKNDWKRLPHLKAVRDGQIHVLIREYSTVPGPRIFNLIEDLKTIIK
jgi:iron complex transport system substrate-binding protein